MTIRISNIVWLSSLGTLNVVICAPLRFKPKMTSIAADARMSALAAAQMPQNIVQVHQRRRRSTHEITSAQHFQVMSHREAPSAPVVSAQKMGEPEQREDFQDWELHCYAPLISLLAAGALWRLWKYLGCSGGFHFLLSGNMVETESGAMDSCQFLSVSIVFLALVIGNDFAVSSASAHNGGGLPVHPACIVCLSELAKVLVTLTIWLAQGRPIDDKQDSENVQLQCLGWSSNAVLCTVGLTMIPAMIYTLNNMLSLFALAHIHIAHIAVLRPTGVAVFNCILWAAVFGQKSPITGSWGFTLKSLGILLCVSGSIVNSYDFREGSLLLAPSAVMILLASTFLSAFGAVANEFVLKYRMQLNIDFQNLCLYCMTVGLSFAVLFSIARTSELHRIWNCPGVRVIVCYNAVMGLAVSRVLKQMGSLSKMVLGIMREPFEVLVAPLFVVSELTPAVFGSTLLTVAGGLLYFLPPGALPRTSSVK